MKECIVPMRWTIGGLAWSLGILLVALADDARAPTATPVVWTVPAVAYAACVYARTVQAIVRLWSDGTARPRGSLESRPLFALDAMFSVVLASTGLWMALYLFDARDGGEFHFDSDGLHGDEEPLLATWYRLFVSAISVATTPGTTVGPKSIAALTVHMVHCLLGIVAVFGLVASKEFDEHDDEFDARTGPDG